jgi:hypothetical protein
MRFRPILKIMAAYAAGVVTAAFFLSGPVAIPGVTPVPILAPLPAATEPAPAPPQTAPPPAVQRPEVRFIPIDRAPNAETVGAAPAEPAEAAQQEPQCNRLACSRAYRSFDPDTCTYQPYTGDARRLCEK